MAGPSSSSFAVQCAPTAVAVLIAASEPGRALLDVVESLVQAGTAAILLVDDGSSAGRQWVFERIGLEPTVHLLRHAKPQGRGAALKTGMRYFIEHLRHYSGLVISSSDGRYATEDVLRVSRALRSSPKLAIVGARQRRISGDLPADGHSDQGSLADRALRVFFRAFTGLALSDPQSRLRALPTALVPRVLGIPGRRNEYELAMLLHMARSGYPMAEHAIASGTLSGGDHSGCAGIGDFLRALRYCRQVDAMDAERAEEHPGGSLNGVDPSVRKQSPAKQTQ